MEKGILDGRSNETSIQEINFMGPDFGTFTLLPSAVTSSQPLITVSGLKGSSHRTDPSFYLGKVEVDRPRVESSDLHILSPDQGSEHDQSRPNAVPDIYDVTQEILGLSVSFFPSRRTDSPFLLTTRRTPGSLHLYYGQITGEYTVFRFTNYK